MNNKEPGYVYIHWRHGTVRPVPCHVNDLDATELGANKIKCSSLLLFLHIACHFRNLFVFLHNNRYWVNMTNIRKYMAITKKINANGTEISILLQGNENDYICLTDMARYKDKQRTDYIIQNW